MKEFARPVAIDRLGAGPIEQSVVADPAELVALTARLMIPSVTKLAGRYRLRRREGGLIEAEGQIEAEVTQVCVVTLEPFNQTVTEAFTVHFVPAGTESEDLDPEAPDEIPYEGGTIDLGEAAAEQLALAIDPYPKSPEAAAQNQEAAVQAGPFAGLAALRLKQ